jgi:hypothetical protein
VQIENSCNVQVIYKISSGVNSFTGQIFSNNGMNRHFLVGKGKFSAKRLQIFAPLPGGSTH